MPWSNDGGDGGNKNGGPWGQGPWGGGNGDDRGKKPNAPRGPESQQDFDELIKKGQERFKKAFPGGGGSGNRQGGDAGSPPPIPTKVFVFGGLVVAFVLWLMNSFYQVPDGRLGVEMIFGKPKESVSTAGLNFIFWPIEKVEIVDAATQRRLNIGANGNQDGLMLSGDQNIVDVRFSVLWRVSSPQDYIFNVRDPEGVVRNVAESAMREYVGQSIAENVRTTQRAEAEIKVQELIQKILDEYQVGIIVDQVVLDSAEPPAQVADAFEEVQRAQQDQDRVQQVATKYRNTVLGQANGEALRDIQKAEGYKQQQIAEALGESQRFEKILTEYQKAKDVTRTRLYLETMEQVYKNSEKVIVDQDGESSGVVPYLPLPEISKRQQQPQN